MNNVGTNIRKKTVDYTAEEYSSIMSTNLDSSYHLCQLAHPLLKASGKGSIVFISSVAGSVHLFSGSIYGATKGKLFFRIEIFPFDELYAAYEVNLCKFCTYRSNEPAHEKFGM